MSRNLLFLSKKSFCTRRSWKKKMFSGIFDLKITGTEAGSVKHYGLWRLAKAVRRLKSSIKFTNNIVREF